MILLIINNLTRKHIEMLAIHIRVIMIKITKYTLLATFFISSISFANSPVEEKVTLPTIIEVISFCSNDKTCTSVSPVIEDQSINYDVKYESSSIIPPPTKPTDPAEEDPDD